MPVPRYVAKVSPTALPGVQTAKQLAEPASAAPAVSQFSRQVFEMAKVEKQRADETAVQAAQTKAIQSRNRMTYDPQTGLMARKGKDALKAGEDLLPAYDEVLNGLETELANESQIAMFRQVRDKEKLEFEGRVTTHTFSEIQQLEADEFKAGVGTKIDDGVLNYRQPGKVADTKLALKNDILARAEKMGWGADMTREAMDGAVSQMHYGIVAREVTNGNYPAAEAWYQKVKASKEVTGQDITRIEAMLRPAKEQYSAKVEMDTAAGLSDDYMMKYVNKGDALVDMEQDHGGKPYYKTMKAEYLRKYQEREDANQFEENKLSYKLVEDALNGRPLASDEMMKVPEDVRAKVKEYQSAIKKWGRAKVSESGDSYLHLRRLAYEKPDAFMRTNLVTYKLDPFSFKSMQNLQIGMIQKSDNAQKELDGISRLHGRIDFSADSLRFRDDAERKVFSSMAEKAVLDFERRYNRQPDDKELVEILDGQKIALKTSKSNRLSE